jgi:transposase InsO family protein
MRDLDERSAVFWCAILRPLLFGEIQKGAVASWLKAMASQEVLFPDGTLRQPSVSTLKRKLRQYRQGGFNALPRKRRKDRGSARKDLAEVLRTAIDAKREGPQRSAETLNLILQERHGKTLRRSTLYRHLKAAGATRLKLGWVQEPVRKRWTCAHTHDLWVGDFSEGPCVLLQGQSVQTHLSAFIDAHSRYVVCARYYLRESLDVLCDTLIRALAIHGVPLALYLDNAKVYHSHSLKTLCCRLHTRLLHRPPGDPAPGGLIERFIQTAQGQFESEARAGEILSLEKLNQAFGAWLEVAYHSRTHSEIKVTPQACYDSGLLGLRLADLQAVAESFLQHENRTVDKTFSDVQLNAGYYRVDHGLRGERLEVRYDPFGNKEKVWLYSKGGEFLGEGLWHDRSQGERPPRPSMPLSRIPLLELLIEKQKRLHAQESGIQFHHALNPQRWPFAAFAACLAELLGRSGGLSAFSADEMSALRAVHEGQRRLTRTLLKKAFLQAGRKSIPSIVYALQNLSLEECSAHVL